MLYEINTVAKEQKMKENIDFYIENSGIVPLKLLKKPIVSPFF